MKKLYHLLQRLFHLLPLSSVVKDRLAYLIYSRSRFLREMQKRDLVQTQYTPVGIESSAGLAQGEEVDYREIERLQAANGVWEWSAYEQVQAGVARKKNQKALSRLPQAMPMFEMGRKSPEVFAQSIHFPVPPSVPEVSIIIPVYNHISLTLECLRSIAEYTGIEVSYEVLVADDASGDDTAVVLGAVPNLILIRNESNLGFLRNCNNALKQVRGKYVLFLNNDVQVTSGWLYSLYHTFLEHRNVGAVGPKFVYPNGYLQEAGAAFRHDAMADMIGLNDDGSKPRYNYARRVDYVSGACLMAPTDLVQKLGGFSEEFLPCYCEDSDLCLRIRQAGFEVYYNPDSVIIHHLSKTTAQIESDFKLRSISKNIVKLKQKWIDEIHSLSAVKAVAFYMPHYYPCPENESYGGKGYIGWTALAKRWMTGGIDKSLLRLPADLGFYDQRRLETLREQVALAKRYGISGFCFYAYRNEGGIAWGEPLSQMLVAGAPDMAYCICLSDFLPGFNEKSVVGALDKAGFSVEMDVLVAHFNHVRYMKVADKPLLLLQTEYQGTGIKTRLAHIREYCQNRGLDDLYIVLAHQAPLDMPVDSPIDLGFDATLELPLIPLGATAYSDFVAEYAGVEFPAYPQFRCVYPGWGYTSADNGADIGRLVGSSPGAFQAWMEAVAEEARIQHFGEERMFFVHAWNDWVNGAYLEPDLPYGHTYLEAVRNALDAPGTLEKNKRYLVN